MCVLLLLAERHGQVVSRSDLEDRAWPRVLVSDEAVTNTLVKLRKALGDDARNPTFIETIAKSGYRLIAEVAPLEAMTYEAPPADMPMLAATPPTVVGRVADANKNVAFGFVEKGRSGGAVSAARLGVACDPPGSNRPR